MQSLHDVTLSNMLSAPDIVMTSLQATFVDSLDEGATDSMIANQSFYVQNAATKAVQSFGKLTDVYEHYTKLLASASRIVELFDVLDEMVRHHPTGIYFDSREGPDGVLKTPLRNWVCSTHIVVPLRGSAASFLCPLSIHADSCAHFLHAGWGHRTRHLQQRSPRTLATRLQQVCRRATM